MTCLHQNGGLQVMIYAQGGWLRRCLCCGDAAPQPESPIPVEAGESAALGFLRRDQRRFSEAAEAFRHAAEAGGGPVCRLAALLCRLGVTWCGDEYQPTFAAETLPMSPLAQSPEWQAVEQVAGQLDPAVYQGMCSVLAQLEEILRFVRESEGRSACDVFLCYRRTPANLQNALRLHRELTAQGLQVFCADVTTRGKTQEQFEAEVYPALRTAEHLVLFPGRGEDALTPWLRNELERAACPRERRMVVSDGQSPTPADVGEVLPLEDIRTRLLLSAGDCTADRLLERAMGLLTAERGGAAALPLLQRASAKGSQPARLMLASLFDEGLVLAADADRAAHYRRLAGAPGDECSRQVNDALNAIEQALHLPRRQAMLYCVADVSDAGVRASQMLLRPLFAGLQADRRLAGAQVCIVGYDRHAAIFEEPKELAKYGLPEHAAGTLRTSREAGRDGCAYAAKGLRCAADHLLRTSCGEGQVPLLVLLRPCPTSDDAAALSAAALLTGGLFRNTAAEVTSAEQLPGCLAALRQALMYPHDMTQEVIR